MNAEKFLQEAGALSMSIEERALIKEGLDCRIALDEIFHAAQKVTLLPGERAMLKEMLFSEIANAPSHSWSFLKVCTKVLAGLVLLIGAGSGISYAAESSLPGDVLYPVKVNITERVRARFRASAEERASFEVELVERRLEEAELLAEHHMLTEERKVVIQKHMHARMNGMQSHLTALRERKAALTLALGTELESSLSAHSSRLRSLKKSDNTTDHSSIDDILADVRSAQLSVEEGIALSETTQVEEEKAEALEVLLTRTEQKLKKPKLTQDHATSDADVLLQEARNAPSAEEKSLMIRSLLRSVKKNDLNVSEEEASDDDYEEIGALARLGATKKKLEAMKEDPGAHTSIDAETKRGGAEQLLHIGQVQLDAGAHREALDAAREALKQVMEAELLPAAPDSEPLMENVLDISSLEEEEGE